MRETQTRKGSLTTAIFQTLNLHKSWKNIFVLTIVSNYVTFMPLRTPFIAPFLLRQANPLFATPFPRKKSKMTKGMAKAQ
jgi:hypothetical protein